MLRLFERKEVSSLFDQDLIFQHSIAKVTADIFPDEIGQVRVSGVYWRARTKSNQCLRVGQKVRVIKRELNTLLVSAESRFLSST